VWGWQQQQLLLLQFPLAAAVPGWQQQLQQQPLLTPLADWQLPLPVGSVVPILAAAAAAAAAAVAPAAAAAGNTCSLPH
jgi:hypothetical protein